jgi:uncharacterized membrane protein YczE
MQSQNPHQTLIYRFIVLMIGLVFCSAGLYLTVQAGLGSNPWTVLSVGAANYIPLTVGQTTQLIGVMLILFSYLLGEKARIGTFCNMFFIGFFYDLFDLLGLFPFRPNPLIQYGYLSAAIACFAIGVGIYLTADFGAGPRDALVIGLQKHLSWSYRLTRCTIEVSVLVLGYLLGGPVGIGTLIFALSSGPAIQLTIKFFSRLLTPLFRYDSSLSISEK